MPRQTSTRISRTSAKEIDSAAPEATIAASPVAVAAEPSVNPEVAGFIRGLSNLNPRLNEMWQQQSAKEAAEGRQAGRAGMTKDDARKRSTSFIEGHLEGMGEAAAISDAADLESTYLEQVDKTGPGLEGFVQRFYTEKTKGLTDERFRAGYNRVFAEQAQRLRQAHGENMARAVHDNNRASAQARIDFALRRRIDMKLPLDESFLTEISDIGEQQRLTGREKDESLFLALKSIGDTGKPEVWEVTKYPRKDSRTGGYLPSLYSNPQWKDKIDAAARTAKTVWMAEQDRAERAAEKRRDEMRDQALGSLILKAMSGDQEGARALATEAFQSPLFENRGSKISEALRIFTDTTDRIKRPGEEEAENKHMVAIYAGSLNQQGILDAPDVGNLAKRRLLSEFYRVQAQKRADEAAARAAAKTEDYFKSPQFRETMGLIGANLKPPRNPFAQITGEDEAALLEAAMAEREFVNWAGQNPGVDNTAANAKAVEIIQRFSALRKNKVDPAARTARHGVPYATMRDLVQAYERGQVDPDTYMMYRGILRSIAQQGSK